MEEEPNDDYQHLSDKEKNLLLVLYEAIKAEYKPYIEGAKVLEIPLNALFLLHKLRYIRFLNSDTPLNNDETVSRFSFFLREPQAVADLPGALVALVQLCSKIQSVSILGSSAQVDVMQRKHVDLDFATFGNMRSLKLSRLNITRFENVKYVVEMHLEDCVLECPLTSFTCIRALHYDRTPVPTRDLVGAAFSLRSLQISHLPNDMELPTFRIPQGDKSTDNNIMPWESLTAVAIRTTRTALHKLDSSWEKLVNLTVLVISGAGLKQLRALEVIQRCVNLLSLDVSNNNISSLEYVSVIAPSVVVLNVSNNHVSSSEGICMLAKLRDLNIEGNAFADWVELKDIASGCALLNRLQLKGNPLLDKIPPADVPAFAASIFNFRQLLLDGQKCENAKGKVNADFLSKYIHLFERTRGGNEISMAPSIPSPRPDAPPILSRRKQPSLATAVAASTPGASVASSFRVKRKKKRVKEAAVDKVEEPVPLPPNQLEVEDDKNGDVYKHKAELADLQEKHGDGWLQQLSTKKMVIVPQRTTPPAQIEKNETAAGTSTRKTKKGKAARQQVQAEDSLAKTHSSLQLSGLQQQLSLTTSSFTLKSSVPLPQAAPRAALKRQTPVKPPSPTLQEFLDSLKVADWFFCDEETSQTTKAFPGGCQTLISAIGPENSDVWECNENIEVQPTAPEVLLHDSRDLSHTYANRHANKVLIRIVEYDSGYTRYVRIEKKNALSAKFEQGRPVLTIMLDATTPTSNIDVPVSVVDVSGMKGAAANERRDRKGSVMDFDSPVDIVDVRRHVHRVMNPKLLAAFVVPPGNAAVLFLRYLKSQFVLCHTRLCVVGVVRVWPFHVDDAPVMKDHDRSVPVRMTMQYIKERMNLYTAEGVSRQRMGCPLIVQGDEMKLILKTYVMQGDNTKETFLCTTYANRCLELPNGKTREIACLIVITNTKLLVANDFNFQGSMLGGKPVTADNVFSDVERQRLDQIQSISVTFNLQMIRFEVDEEMNYTFFTRDTATTFSILAALAQAGRTEIEIHGCPYNVTTAPLIFSVGVMMRPIGQRMQNDPTVANYPLRHVKERMDAVTLVIAASEVIVFDESFIFSLGEAEVADRRPVGSITNLLVAGEGLFPLVFGIEFGAQQGAGSGKSSDCWIMAAQHPNTIACIAEELKQLQPNIEISDLSKEKYLSATATVKAKSREVPSQRELKSKSP